MSSTSPSSIFRRERADPSALLVNAPRCAERQTSDGVVKVESESFHSVDTSEKKTNPIARFFEANFGGEKKAEEKEMQEIGERSVKIVSPACKREIVNGFDICREYSYSGDEDDNRETFIYPPPPLVPIDASTVSVLNGSESDQTVLKSYLLGRTYHPINDYNTRRDDESSLFWFTYRCDFPEIAPYNITSDAGWGCMLRSAQMMLGQALRLHFKSRSWRPAHHLTKRRQDPFVRSILTWFADFPSSNECVYSLHNMVAAGLAKYDKLPGEWYGPQTACYVMRDLVELHDKHQTVGGTKKDNRLFRVHVAAGGTVYRDVIEQLMTRDSKAMLDQEKDRLQQEAAPTHPLDLAWEEELIEITKDVVWDTALLLLIPLRLGLNSFNEDYIRAVAYTFALPQSVGVLGGRPRGARWFYGALSDGSKIFGLDPHTVQSAPRRRTARVNGMASSVVDLSDEYMRSVHTTYPEVFSLQKMDPSIALGFYCKSASDLEYVISRLREWHEAHPDVPQLFTVGEKSPDYDSNVSSALGDMLISNMTNSVLDDEESQISEEDEYVML